MLNEATEHPRGSALWWSNVADAAREMRRKRCEPIWNAIRALHRNRSGDERGGVKYYPNGGRKVNQVKPSRMYALERGVQTGVFYKRPKFFVRPYVGHMETMALDWERIANALWPRVVSDKDLRWCVSDSFLYGRSYLLMGFWADDEEERRRYLKRKRLAEKISTDPAGETLAPEQIAALESQPAVKPENEREPEIFTGSSRELARRPFGVRVSPFEIIRDMDAKNFNDLRWLGREILVDIAALRADKTLKNAHKVRPTQALNTEGRVPSASPAAFDRPEMPEPYEYALLYEIAEKQPDGTWDVFLLAKDHDWFLRKRKAPYWMGCPWTTLAWNDDGDSFDPVSDAEYLLPGVIEEQDIRSRVRDHWQRKPNDVTFVTRECLGNNANMAAKSTAEVGSYVPVENPSANQNVPLSHHFFQLQRNANLAEVYQHLNLIQQDFMAVAGLGPNQQLQAMKSETSATEANEVAQASRARGSEKQAAVEDFCAEACHKMLMLVAQYFDGRRMSDFASVETTERWKTKIFDAGDVQDGLGVQVERGSMRPQSSEDRVQLLTFLLNSALTNPAFAAKVNVEEVLNRIAEERGILDGTKLLNENINMTEVVMALGAQQLVGGGNKAAPAPVGGNR